MDICGAAVKREPRRLAGAHELRCHVTLRFGNKLALRSVHFPPFYAAIASGVTLRAREFGHSSMPEGVRKQGRQE